MVNDFRNRLFSLTMSTSDIFYISLQLYLQYCIKLSDSLTWHLRGWILNIIEYTSYRFTHKFYTDEVTVIRRFNFEVCSDRIYQLLCRLRFGNMKKKTFWDRKKRRNTSPLFDFIANKRRIENIASWSEPEPISKERNKDLKKTRPDRFDKSASIVLSFCSKTTDELDDESSILTGDFSKDASKKNN